MTTNNQEPTKMNADNADSNCSAPSSTQALDQPSIEHQSSSSISATSKQIPSTSNGPTNTISSTPAKNQNSTGTTRMGRFKDKRPEPLNLNKSINQEIPLDLSVKSAGILRLDTNIFNLSGPGLLTTLETPRIAWQDNEALLLKQRLLSSSTNANHMLRLSSFAGESPPITPGTPFLDLLYSPTLIHAAGLPGFLQDSSTSPQSLMSAQYKQQQHRPFDDNQQTGPQTNKTIVHRTLNGSRDGSDGMSMKVPRRSCSTDNLSSLSKISAGNMNSSTRAYQLNRCQQQQQQQIRKAPISPITMKDSNKLPGIVSNQRSEINDKNKTDELGSKYDEAALIPTSIANATKNLLKIHLNSPTYYGDISNQTQSMMEFLELQKRSTNEQQQQHKVLVINDNNHSDPLLSAAYCQQYQQNPNSTFGHPHLQTMANSYSDAASNRENYLATSYQQTQQHPATTSTSALSSTSSATLNTSTLVSPNALKGYFLPSPLLSPMSSVFELPSPILMFPPEQKSPKEPNDKRFHLLKGPVTSSVTQSGSIGAGTPIIASNQDRLAQLVTSAKDKTSEKSKNEEGMEVDEVEMKGKALPKIFVSTNGHPGTTEVSNENSKNDSMQSIENQNPFTNIDTRPHREVLAKRALSPQSFRSRVNQYCDERVESSSAPPHSADLKLVRPKIKSATASSGPDMGPEVSTKELMARPPGCPLRPTQVVQSYRQLEQQSDHYACGNLSLPPLQQPNFGPQNNLSSSSYCTQSIDDVTSGFQAPTHRSSSAEPRVYSFQQHQHLPFDRRSSNFDATQTHYYQSGGELPPSDCQAQLLAQHAPAQYQHQQHHHQHHQHLNLHHYQPHQSQALPLVSGYNFSQSSHQLNATGASSDYTRSHPSAASGGYNLTNQCQSVSADELDRRSLSLSRCEQPADNSHCHNGAGQSAQHQHLQPLPQVQTQHPPMSLQTTHSSSLSTYYNSSNQPFPQAAIQRPLESISASTLEAPDTTNPAAYEHSSRQLPGSDGILEKRASSAEVRAISRSESLQSCSSADLCFRSNSAASSSAPKKYHCDQCPKAFTRSDMLTRHRRLHSGDRPFQCSACKQEFSRSDHLSTHMRTHTGEKPYKCKLCFYSACRKDMITRHIKVHNRSCLNSHLSDSTLTK